MNPRSLSSRGTHSSPQTPHVVAPKASLPLDRGGGLAGDVEDHAVDPAHFVDDAARDAGEGAEAQPDETQLVLEELPQRLDELEAELAREPPHVVVALDHHRRAAHRGRLDHVGVERALGQEPRAPRLARGRAKHLDELPADDLALALGVADPLQPGEETAGRVHEDDLPTEALGEPPPDPEGTA